MKPSNQSEPTADLTPGQDRAMHGLLHEFASHQTTDDEAFLSALETALDTAASNSSAIPLAEPIGPKKPSHRWWKWGLAGSAAACAVGMLVWRDRKPTVILSQELTAAQSPSPITSERVPVVDPSHSIAESEVIARLQRIELARKTEAEGDRLLVDGDYEGAVRHFHQALSVIPNAPISAVDRGRIISKFSNACIKEADKLGKQGRLDEGKILLKRVLVADVDQDNAAAKTLLKRLDDPDYYDPNIAARYDKNGKEIASLLKEGLVYFDLGQFNEAESSFNKILAIDPHNEAARRQLEKTEHEIDNYVASARDHTRAHMLRNVDEIWETTVPHGTTGGGYSPSPRNVPGSGVGTATSSLPNQPPQELAKVDSSISGFAMPSSGGIGGGEGGLRGKGRGGMLGDGMGRGVGPGNGNGFIGRATSSSDPRFRNKSRAEVDGKPMSQSGKELLASQSGYAWDYSEQSNPTDPTNRTDLRSTADRYNPAIENPFLSPLKAPLSTFSVDVDTASYANLRRMIQEGRAVPPAAVRIEEMVNYFTYDYPQPEGAHPFSVNVETASCPWAPTHRLVKIGLKAKEIAKEKRPSANLVFLCDVSGSMNSPDKLPLLVENLKMLTSELNADDTVGIVVYAGNQGVALPPTSGGNKETILKALSNLSSGGSTNGGAGITRAYQMAQERFVKGGINRVVLCTDGDFNVGTTSNDALVNLVKEKAAGGVFLTVCGYGRGNLNDAMLESITDKGNGVYHYVDSEKEGKKIFKDELFGTLMTVAKDVKLQVEFNPDKVGSYRLVGYDNRMLKKEDFANDKVDAGDIGAGHCVTALYEVIPPGVDEPQQPADDLKYQKGQSPVVNTDPSPAPKVISSPETLTVKLRYKEPDATESKLLEVPHTDAGQTLVAASSDFKFASAVAEFGERLRGKRPEGRNAGMIQEQAESARGNDPHGLRGEFIELVKKVMSGLHQ